jgi:hypothetical protein
MFYTLPENVSDSQDECDDEEAEHLATLNDSFVS